MYVDQDRRFIGGEPEPSVSRPSGMTYQEVAMLLVFGVVTAAMLVFWGLMALAGITAGVLTCNVLVCVHALAGAFVGLSIVMAE